MNIKVLTVVALSLVASSRAHAERYDCGDEPTIFLEQYDDLDRDGSIDHWLIVGRVCGIVVVDEGLGDPFTPELDDSWETAMGWLVGKTSPLDAPPDAPPDTPSLLEQCMDGAKATCGAQCVASVKVTVDGCEFTCKLTPECGPGTAPVKPPPSAGA